MDTTTVLAATPIGSWWWVWWRPWPELCAGRSLWKVGCWPSGVGSGNLSAFFSLANFGWPADGSGTLDTVLEASNLGCPNDGSGALEAGVVDGFGFSKVACPAAGSGTLEAVVVDVSNVACPSDGSGGGWALGFGAAVTVTINNRPRKAPSRVQPVVGDIMLVRRGGQSLEDGWRRCSRLVVAEDTVRVCLVSVSVYKLFSLCSPDFVLSLVGLNNFLPSYSSKASLSPSWA